MRIEEPAHPRFTTLTPNAMETVLIGILALILLVYLAVALTRPELF